MGRSFRLVRCWRRVGAVAASVAMVAVLTGAVAVAANGRATAAASGGYVPVGPTRIASGLQVGPGASVKVPVLGVGGVPSGGVSAVSITLTGNDAQTSYLTAYPDGTAVPYTSLVSLNPNQTAADGALVAPGASGAIDVYNNLGTATIYVDVSGYYSSTSTTGYTPLSPATRIAASVPVGAGATTVVQVAGTGGMPGAGVSAVAATLTASGAANLGYMVCYADGQARPGTSSNNLNPGVNSSVLSQCPVGTDGKIDIYSSAAVNVSVDAEGYYSPGTAGSGSYTPVTQTRIVSTNISSAGTLTEGVTGAATVPATAVAVAVDITLASCSQLGYLEEWPAGQSPPSPAISQLNTNSAAQANTTDLVLAQPGANGQITIKYASSSTGSCLLYLDVVGYFGAPTPTAPAGVAAYAGNQAADVVFSPPSADNGTAISSYTVVATPNSGPPITQTVTCSPTMFNCENVPINVVIGGPGTPTALTNGTAYNIQVYANSAAGTSPPGAASATVTPTASPAPYPPVNVITSPGNASAFVGWGAPVAGTATVTSYVVQAYDASNNNAYVNQVTGITAQNLIFTGLTNGHSYVFAIYACDSAGCSVVASPPVTPTASPPPFPVTNPQVITSAASTAVITWTAPSGGVTPTSYTITAYQVADNGTLTMVPASSGFSNPQTATTTIATFNNLPNTAPYTGPYVFKITANANNLSSTPVSTAPPVGPNSAVTKGYQPTGVNAVGADKTAVVSWTAPTVGVVLGYQIDTYTVTTNTSMLYTGATVTVSTTGSCSAGSTSDPPAVGPLMAPCAVVTGLANGSNYDFVVRSTLLGATVGTSPNPSNTVTAYGAAQGPAINQVIGDPTPIGGLLAVYFTPDTVAQDNGSPVTGYTATATPITGGTGYNPNAGTAPTTTNLTLTTPNQAGGAESPSGCTQPPPSGEDCILIGLPQNQQQSADGPASGALYDGSPYNVQVAANNAAGLTPTNQLTNNSATPFGVPFAPTIGVASNPSSSGVGLTQVSLTWTPPSPNSLGVPGDNGNPITGFQIYQSNGDSFNVNASSACNGDPDQPSTPCAAVIGTSPIGRYTFSVSAENAANVNGPGPKSQPSNVVTVAAVPTPPGDPEVYQSGDTDEVWWQASDPNFSNLSGYTVTPIPQDTSTYPNGSPSLPVEQVGPSTLSYSYQVAPGAGYNFNIYATNAVGQSATVTADDSPTPPPEGNSGGGAGGSPPSAPSVTKAYYINGVDVNYLSQQACAAAQTATSSGDPSMVIFFVGVPYPDGSGTESVFGNEQELYYDGTNPQATSGTNLTNLGASYAASYDNCATAKTPSTTIVMEVNNNAQMSNTTGMQFANFITGLAQTIDGLGIGAHVLVAGGNDAEVEYESAAMTETFVTGYTSAGSNEFVDSGDVSDCPPTYNATPNNTCTGHAWADSDIATVADAPSSGGNDGVPVPQMYQQPTADAWGVLIGHFSAFPAGVLEEIPRTAGNGACGFFSSAQGSYTALENEYAMNDPNGVNNVIYLSELQNGYLVEGGSGTVTSSPSCY